MKRNTILYILAVAFVVYLFKDSIPIIKDMGLPDPSQITSKIQDLFSQGIGFFNDHTLITSLLVSGVGIGVARGLVQRATERALGIKHKEELNRIEAEYQQKISSLTHKVDNELTHTQQQVASKDQQLKNIYAQFASDRETLEKQIEGYKAQIDLLQKEKVEAYRMVKVATQKEEDKVD